TWSPSTIDARTRRLDAAWIGPYARRMHEPKQGGGEDTLPEDARVEPPGEPPGRFEPTTAPVAPGSESPAESVHAAAVWGDEAPAGDSAAPAVDPGPPVLRGLRTWLIVIGVLGLGGVIFRQAELALMVTLAGAFAAAHAAH